MDCDRSIYLFCYFVSSQVSQVPGTGLIFISQCVIVFINVITTIINISQFSHAYSQSDKDV